MLQRASFAALALVISGAILWVATTGSDNPNAKARATSPLEKKAVKIEEQVAADPQNEKLLITAIRTRIRAGADKLEAIEPRTQPIPGAVPEDYKAGLRAWTHYLKRTDGEATARLAETISVTYFQLVEIGSSRPAEATANAAGAVRAQKIVCVHAPSLYTFSNLATYRYFNGEYATGDKAAREAVADASEAGWNVRDVVSQLNEYKERGEKFVARVKRGFESLEETGEDELETPIKGYGAPAGLNGYEPGTGPA
jgi:hypothetical protein